VSRCAAGLSIKQENDGCQLLKDPRVPTGAGGRSSSSSLGGASPIVRGS
jgi:hypothetical protein